MEIAGVAVKGAAFSPDGHLVIAGYADGGLRLWEAATGRLVRHIQGHQDWVRSVAISPDGRRAVSASDDETIGVWDIETGVELQRLTGHTWSVVRAVFSPEGTRILSASDDTTLRLWGAVLNTADRLAGPALLPDNLTDALDNV
jgi:WD40 repeat protein